MAKPDERLPFTIHLVELRKRLINCVIAVGIGFVISYSYSKELFDFLAVPLMGATQKGNAFMVFTGIIEPFFTYLKISLMGGVILASPVIFHQIWLFIAPGLYPDERKWVVPVIVSASILFMGGVVFGYYVVIPVGFGYFLSFATDTLKPMLAMKEYFSFMIRFLLAFGIVFEMPLVVFFLARLGIVEAKTFIQYRKYAVLVIFIIAAVITPTPDAFSQLLMAGPMIVLYEVGLLLARLFGKKRVKEQLS